ncbi:MAG: DUF1517 domain-containing protein [Myxococcota bacterium]|nr:DUF1517 domain-containing protein [Myxococcota bacterium]
MRLLLAFAFALTFACPALAQSTGSSFGSSDWGSTSSGGGGFSSSGSSDFSTGSAGSAADFSSGGFDASSSTGGSGARGPIDYAIGGTLFAILVLGIGWAWWSAAREIRDEADPGLIDVALVSIALGGTARTRMQRRLPRIARGLGSTRARYDALREVISSLRDSKEAWVYGRIVDHLPRAAGHARRDLERHAAELRARYRHELLRGTDARATERSAPEPTRRAEEGDGLVVVSLVVAARDTIEDARTVSVERLDRLLQRLREIPIDRLVALEVTWSPASDRDRLSSAELEVVYPEMVRLVDRPLGRVTCASCGVVSTAELATCPSCGAPRPASPPARGPAAEAAREDAPKSLREIMRAKRGTS